MKKNSCPNFEKLLDYSQRLLETEKSLKIQHHLTQCPDCPQELARLQLLLADLRADAAIEVPAQARRRAMAFYQAWKPKVASWRTVLANLVFDTGLELRPAGLRAEVSVTSRSLRQLLYSVENGKIEIDLQLHATQPGKFRLIGQVLGSDSQERRVELAQPGQSQILEAKADEESFTFYFQDLPGGEYNLKLYCDEEAIEVPLIKL